jgi:hypothetical protein
MQSAIRDRQMDVDHLDRRQLVQHRSWCQSRCQRSEPLLQRHLQAVVVRGCRLDSILLTRYDET